MTSIDLQLKAEQSNVCPDIRLCAQLKYPDVTFILIDGVSGGDYTLH